MKKIISILILCYSNIALAQSGVQKAKNTEATNTFTIAGKSIKKISDDSLLSAGSSSSLVTERAVKTYVDGSKNFINVVDFGVKGDGITNNTIALQKAINTASERKRVLFFPAGVYLTNAVFLKSNLSILGEGETSIIKPISIKSENYVYGCIFYNGYNMPLYNIRFENITLDGNCASYSYGESALINIFFSSNIQFQNCSFKNSLSVGLSLMYADNVIINQCYFENFGWNAIHAVAIKDGKFTNNITLGWSKKDLDKYAAWSFPSVNSYNVIVSNNSFVNTSKATEFAIELYGCFSNQFEISNNTFDANGYKGSGISGAFRNSIIKGNKFINGSGTWRCGLEVQIDSSIIESNIINNGAISITPFTSVSHHVKNGKVINNIINTTVVNERCIQVGGGDEAMKDTISNLVISGNIINAASAKTAECIYIGFYGRKANTADVVVTGNIIRCSETAAGIRVGGISASNVLVTDNMIRGGQWGIYVDKETRLTNITVANNRLDEVSQKALPDNRLGLNISNNILDNKLFFKTDKLYLSDLNSPPKSANASGTKGEIRVTTEFIYVCVDDNSWVRTPLSKW